MAQGCYHKNTPKGGEPASFCRWTQCGQTSLRWLDSLLWTHTWCCQGHPWASRSSLTYPDDCWALSRCQKLFLSKSKITGFSFCNMLSKFRSSQVAFLKKLEWWDAFGLVHTQIGLFVRLDNLGQPLFMNLELSDHLLIGLEWVLLWLGLDLGHFDYHLYWLLPTLPQNLSHHIELFWPK